MITKGVCTYGGKTLKPGGHWGQNDMASTKQPLRATAITYLHVNYVTTQVRVRVRVRLRLRLRLRPPRPRPRVRVS